MYTKTYGDGVTATIHEADDKPCTNPHGHEFAPERGAAYGANGNCCAYCGHFAGIEYHEKEVR